jgi:hypothetical protein
MRIEVFWFQLILVSVGELAMQRILQNRTIFSVERMDFLLRRLTVKRIQGHFGQHTIVAKAVEKVRDAFVGNQLPVGIIILDMDVRIIARFACYCLPIYAHLIGGVTQVSWRISRKSFQNPVSSIHVVPIVLGNAGT